mmetsp:Transcript_21220/g.47720  ORF Transcript_21220/g.47720 Transcript_21220/m.47720 type:complete len:235 (-) Transcript_21220:186-890(-)
MDEHVHTAYAIELTPECLEVLCLELRHLGLLQDFLRPSLCLRDHGGADVAAAHQCSPFSEGDGEVASAAPGVADSLTGDLHAVQPAEDLLDSLCVSNSDVPLHWIHVFGLAINTFPAAEALAVKVLPHDLLVIHLFLRRTGLVTAHQDCCKGGSKDERPHRQGELGIDGRGCGRYLGGVDRGGGRSGPQGAPELRHFPHCGCGGRCQPATLGSGARHRTCPHCTRAHQGRHQKT